MTCCPGPYGVHKKPRVPKRHPKKDCGSSHSSGETSSPKARRVSTKVDDEERDDWKVVHRRRQARGDGPEDPGCQSIPVRRGPGSHESSILVLRRPRVTTEILPTKPGCPDRVGDECGTSRPGASRVPGTSARTRSAPGRVTSCSSRCTTRGRTTQGVYCDRTIV